MKKKIIISAVIAVVVLAAIAIIMVNAKSGVAPDQPPEKPLSAAAVAVPSGIPDAAASGDRVHAGADGRPVRSSEARMSEDIADKKDEKELRVDAFDAETDRWMDAETTKPPTMEDVEAFAAKFREVPKERKEECLHRALNLVPDENVMLLVGILMDKEMDKGLVELVYNDVLNRSEDVKKPILQQIFKDRSHPCWADTAWILDVTGEKPGKDR